MEYKRNKETGILEIWQNGKKIGEVITIGDIINGNTDNDERGQLERGVV